MAVWLWVAWAVVTWSVVFDHAIEVAGRRSIAAAAAAAKTGGPYARVDQWMRPAVTTGLWTASAVAIVIVGAGLIGIRWAGSRSRSCA